MNEAFDHLEEEFLDLLNSYNKALLFLALAIIALLMALVVICFLVF